MTSVTVLDENHDGLRKGTGACHRIRAASAMLVDLGAVVGKSKAVDNFEIILPVFIM